MKVSHCFSSLLASPSPWNPRINPESCEILSDIDMIGNRIALHIFILGFPERFDYPWYLEMLKSVNPTISVLSVFHPGESILFFYLPLPYPITLSSGKLGLLPNIDRIQEPASAEETRANLQLRGYRDGIVCDLSHAIRQLISRTCESERRGRAFAVTGTGDAGQGIRHRLASFVYHVLQVAGLLL